MGITECRICQQNVLLSCQPFCDGFWTFRIENRFCTWCIVCREIFRNPDVTRKRLVQFSDSRESIDGNLSDVRQKFRSPVLTFREDE